MNTISLVNYGLGNIKAFINIYQKLSIPVKVVSNPDELWGAEKILLPGVGSFDWAMTLLNNSGLRAVLDELVLNKKTPILGVCVGMQIMARQSDEGELRGLEWLDAEVNIFKHKTQLPHMGWNQVSPKGEVDLFKNITSPRFYFLHSYYVDPASSTISVASTDYEGIFTSVVSHDNIWGVQFHPEKSHHCGVQLLKNFAEL
ncbi:imidazole glycerol phosphate synthase subunit HisH [Cylindrospermopsis sp. CR12]|uniref:imidazole glycerol phosphate synthase subunit HisH n=2 Tax=Cylindrospermopsis TaxID=77021 RepID=UPI000710C1FC|nr:imidazole glycerol phosphate synthase subunit HisH [Cylindrospermopsis sp. CR12]KRH96861.1 imidazole glycerol phosphate synthase subunit HisH [Cylindrospermopsis sp. CR12]